MATPSPRRFKQVDVFTSVAFKGNPLAVVLDADGLSDEQMHAIARWTNLSETTFVLAPRDPAADYRVRIFSPGTEFPFAGHPTLGTAHALLDAGLQPGTAGQLVQECGVGLVPIRIRGAGALAFRAPEASLQALHPSMYPALERALGTGGFRRGTGRGTGRDSGPVIATMGIGWLVVNMDSAAACLAVEPDLAGLLALTRDGVTGIALYAEHAAGGPADYEVRAFFTKQGMLAEDPVTGSANACIARVLHDQGRATAYSARQGTQLQCDGRISVVYEDGAPWIGGHSVTVIDGTIAAG